MAVFSGYLWEAFYNLEEMSNCVIRFFEEISKRGFKKGCFLSLLMRGYFYKRIFQKWRVPSPLTDIIYLNRKRMSKKFQIIFSKGSKNEPFGC